MDVTSVGSARRSAQDWEAIVARWKKSGLSVAAFSKEQGIHPASLHRWRRRLEESGSDPDFLTWQAPEELSSTLASSAWSLEVVLPTGVTLRFQG